MQRMQALAETQSPLEPRAYVLYGARPRPWSFLETPALRACRPRQWFKNGVVLLGPAAAGMLTRPGAVAAVFGALVAFCLLSSAGYLINDVRDRAQDRLHPRKRMRPIAAGELSPRAAVRLGALLAVGGVVLAFIINPALAAVAVGYVALTASYSLLWRRIAVVDLLAVAAGFPVRGLAGDVAAHNAPSVSFLLVISGCALFFVSGKRYAELATRVGPSARRVLHTYTPRLLRWLLVGSATLACAAYALWAFQMTVFWPWLDISLLIFVLWLGRYATKLGSGAGEVPEEVVVGDTTLLTLSLLWALLFLLGIYGPS